jgi:hypothetical protein
MTPLKANTFISFILLFVLLLLSGGAASQRRRAKVAPPNIQRTDTLQVGDSLQMGDSLQGGKGLPADSLQQDTVAAAPPKKDALDAPVAYEANDSIVFTQSGFAHLYGQGKVSYPGADLEADVISMDMDNSTVFARGVVDSVGTAKGRPVFKDGDTSYETDTIRYNFKSKRGLISNISTIVHRKYPVSTFQHRKGNNRLPRFPLGIKNGFSQKGNNHKHTQQRNKPERLLSVRHTLFVFYVFWTQR